MKKIYSIAIASALALSFSGCTNEPAPASVKKVDVNTIDVKKVCDVKANGLANVLAQAKLYNPTAVKHKVEFMRFGASTRAYIKGAEAAIKSGSATANIKQKKKVVKMKTDYATWRACSFAIRALQQEHEAKSTWRKSVPGDGFKY